MTLSLSLLLGLFFFAPGFAVYGALFLGASQRFSAAPPAPNSMFTLAIVTFGTLAAHTLAACLFLIDISGIIAGRSIHLAFPDIYGSVLALATEHPPKPPGAAFAAFLLTCMGLSLVSFAAAFLVIRYCATAADFFRRTNYGWLAKLVKTALPPNRAVSAFVVTTLVKDGAYVGYEGFVENLSLAADKQIAVIHLSDCNVFLLRVGRTVRRERVQRDYPIPLITLGGGDIANVAFTVVQYADPTPPPPSSAGRAGGSRSGSAPRSGRGSVR